MRPPELTPPREPLERVGSVELLDGHGVALSRFEVGDNLLVRCSGLSAERSHTVRLVDQDQVEVLAAELLSNRHGEIEPTVLWPDIGLGDPETGNRHEYATLAEAQGALGDGTCSVEVLNGEDVTCSAVFEISSERTRRRLLPVSESGELQRGLLLGQEDLLVRGEQFPPGTIIDLYLLPRHYDWRDGDEFEPVTHDDGTLVTAQVRLEPHQTDFTACLWPADRTQPGSYDVLGRVVLDDEFGVTERLVRPHDVLSERLLTTVVIRSEPGSVTPFRGAIPPVGMPVHHIPIIPAEIAGEKLQDFPHFVFTNVFPVGADIWAGLDAAALGVGSKGKRKIRYYVVKHRTTWRGGETLTDVRPSQPSSTPASARNTTTAVVTSPGCVNGNISLIWSNATAKGDYDLVVDTGTPPNPVSFKGDGRFDPDKGDLIDKLPKAGFSIVDDPSVKPAGRSLRQKHQIVGSYIPIKAGGVTTPGGPFGAATHGVINRFEIRADVYYPHHAVAAPLPLLILIPGYARTYSHHTNYPYEAGYDYLLKHAVEFGFAAVTIRTEAHLDTQLTAGAGADSRVNALFEHLLELEKLHLTPQTGPGGIPSNWLHGRLNLKHIYLMGFGVGADAAIEAAVVNQKGYKGTRNTGPGHFGIKGVIAVSPEDQRGGTPDQITLSTGKLLAIYGSNDGVNTGWNPTFKWYGSAFSMYDRAPVEKAMVFIEGGTYGRFNQQDNLAIGKLPGGVERFVDATAKTIASQKAHEDLLKGYVAAFLLAHQHGLTDYQGYLTGKFRIPQARRVNVFTQHQNPTKRLVVENYEKSRSGPSTPSKKNRLGGTISYRDLAAPTEGMLHTLDSYCIHDALGIKIRWGATQPTSLPQMPRYVLQIPQQHGDVSAFGYLSFRVAQTVGSTANATNKPQNFWVVLGDAANRERAALAAHFGDIPYPYRPRYAKSYTGPAGIDPGALRTKAALTTIRVPLHVFTMECVPDPSVDLSAITMVAFDFDAVPSGEILVTDIEFTM